jgi:hypothetical protein
MAKNKKINLKRMELLEPIQLLFDEVKADFLSGDDVYQAVEKFNKFAKTGQFDKSGLQLASTVVQNQEMQQLLSAAKTGDARAANQIRRSLIATAAQAMTGPDKNKLTAQALAEFGSVHEKQIGRLLKRARADQIKGLFTAVSSGNLDESLARTVLNSVDRTYLQNTRALGWLAQIDDELQAANKLFQQDPKAGVRAAAKVAETIRQAPKGVNKTIAKDMLRELNAARNVGRQASRLATEQAIANKPLNVIGRTLAAHKGKTALGIAALAAAGLAYNYIRNRPEPPPPDNTPLSLDEQRGMLLSSTNLSTAQNAAALVQSRLQTDQANQISQGQIDGAITGALTAKQIESLNQMGRHEIPIVPTTVGTQAAMGMQAEAQRADAMRALGVPAGVPADFPL